MTPQPFNIDTLLERAATEDASDLHVTAGSAPLLRVRGRLALARFGPRIEEGQNHRGQPVRLVQDQRVRRAR